MKMRVRFYVDAFNFYYNVVKVANVKWLDLERCLRLTVKKHLDVDIEVERIKFFTSMVSGEGPHNRQKIYHKALEAHSPNIKLKFGKLRRGEKRGKLITKCSKCKGGKLTVKCSQCGQDDIVKIKFREEKQTDVNLATAMVEDIYVENGLRDLGRGRFDLVCLVSNDSDLLAALAILKKLEQRTILLPPLINESSRHKNDKALRKMMLNPDRDCIWGFKGNVGEYQLPDLVGGKFRIPEKWRA